MYGDLLGPGGEVIDRALATFSRAPHSYTGEDTAEFQCHGSPMVLQLGLEALFAQGARQAGPGEFTRRAFLNGRLDLAQAEAVADLIEAETPAAVHQAAGQLSGALSRRVGAIYDGLVDLLAHFHAVLDYPDEDIDPFRADTIRAGWRRPGRGCPPCWPPTTGGGTSPGGCPAPWWAGPTRASPPCSTPWRGMSGPSSPTCPAPPGTRWRPGAAWAG